MKNKILIFSILMIAINCNAFAWTILEIHKSGGIFGYYKNVDVDQYTVNGMNGVVITCEGGGFNRCRAGVAYTPPPNIDGTDWNNALNLYDQAELEISLNNLTGSYGIQVQVEGENFIRTYMVHWNASNTYGDDSNIIVERGANI